MADELEVPAAPPAAAPAPTAVEAAPARAAAAPVAKPGPILAKEAAIEACLKDWLKAHVHNSPLSRASDAYNHLTSVLPHLVAKLAKEV
jgi:3-oxoacyl-ACP reductase-like protein